MTKNFFLQHIYLTLQTDSLCRMLQMPINMSLFFFSLSVNPHWLFHRPFNRFMYLSIYYEYVLKDCSSSWQRYVLTMLNRSGSNNRCTMGVMITVWEGRRDGAGGDMGDGSWRKEVEEAERWKRRIYITHFSFTKHNIHCALLLSSCVVLVEMVKNECLLSLVNPSSNMLTQHVSAHFLHKIQ